MAWALSSWLVFIRIWQLIAAVAAAGMNGFLTARIWKEHLGLTETIVILELLICILLVYTTLAIWIQQTAGRATRKGWLIAFIVFDILFCAVDLGIITLLSRAGLPDHCQRLTRPNLNQGVYGFTTLGFSDSSEGQEGALDRYCGYERSFFVIALALIFTYILTIVISSLSIYSTTQTKNTKADELLDPLERARGDDTMDLKTLDSASASTSAPTQSSSRISVTSPLSEGIITRTASLRSTLTSFTASTTHRTGTHTIARRPVPPSQQDPPPLPSRFPSPPKPSSGSEIGFVPVPLDEPSAEAEAALVADGMQRDGRQRASMQQQSMQQQSMQQQSMQQQSMQQGHRRGGSSGAYHQHQQQGMPMLLEEEQTAESALVSDGMRPEGMLPPYEPRQGAWMTGHSGENNEMRLSEYVKGGTRAQEEKDRGGF